MNYDLIISFGRMFPDCSLAELGATSYSVCSLAEILEPHVAPKYYLSPRACRGILRRAMKGGRVLPPQLEAALKAVAELPTP